MKKFLILSVSLTFCFGFGLCYAGLSIDPSVTNISSKQGTVYKGKYLLKNTYDRNIDITIEAEKGNTFSGNTDVDVKKWLEFERYKYFIPAGETIEVPYTAIIDKKFKGSVSARVNFYLDQEKGQMINMSMTVPIYVTVNGTEKIDFVVDSLKLFVFGNNISYKLVLENRGNVHIRHSGSIEIYGKKKKNLLKIISIPETVPTYCENKREFSGIMLPKTELKKGKYVAVFKVRALGKEVQKEIKFKVSKIGEVAQ